MQALTSERVREHFAPGDTVMGARGDVHTVFKVLHTGYGFAGALLTFRSTRNGHFTYVTWVVTAKGDVRATMTSADFPLVHGAFAARVTEALRAEGYVHDGS